MFGLILAVEYPPAIMTLDVSICNTTQVIPDCDFMSYTYKLDWNNDSGMMSITNPPTNGGCGRNASPSHSPFIPRLPLIDTRFKTLYFVEHL